MMAHGEARDPSLSVAVWKGRVALDGAALLAARGDAELGVAVESSIWSSFAALGAASEGNVTMVPGLQIGALFHFSSVFIVKP